MKPPAALHVLIDDGVIDEVLRPLKSGKEAAVYVVRSGGEVRCAKVYKDMAQRSFQQRVQYQEGSKVRGSREARAMGKATRYGRRQQEEQWKNTEADRPEEHTSELQSLMRTAYAVFTWNKKTKQI